MARAPALLGLVVAASTIVWCTSFGTAPALGPDAGVFAEAGAALPPAGDGGVCPSGGGPAMVRIQTARGSFCIDLTEVTNGQYLTFLERTGSGAQAPYPPPCPRRDDAIPRNDQAEALELDKMDPQLPVFFVDWCEASAFCGWAGKRLCGALGAHGAPASFVDSGNGSNVTDREWGVACSGEDGGRTFPYGSTFEQGRCDDGSKGLDPVEVGTLDCKSPYAVADLSGNATEWEDACEDADAGARCLRRGGSNNFGPGNQDIFKCDFALTAGRLTDDKDNGFRCCSD